MYYPNNSITPIYSNNPNYLNNPNTYPNVAANQQMANQQIKNIFEWVQGEAGARGFMVPAGMTAWLMDSDSMTFYIKSTDQNGIPQPLRIFDFKERTPQPYTGPDGNVYVTKDEMKKYIKEILHESAIRTNEPGSAESNAEHGANVTTVSELPKQL